MPGGLLHRHFTLTGITSGGMLSVALSFPEIYSPASFVRRTSRPAESGLSSPVKNGAAAVTVSHTHILYIIFPEIQEKTTAFVQDKQTDGAIPQMHPHLRPCRLPRLPGGRCKRQGANRRLADRAVRLFYC